MYNSKIAIEKMTAFSYFFFLEYAPHPTPPPQSIALVFLFIMGFAVFLVGWFFVCLFGFCCCWWFGLVFF